MWWLFIPRFLGLVLELVKLVVGYWDELLISDVRECQVPSCVVSTWPVGVVSFVYLM